MNVAIVFHEKIPFNLEVLMKFGIRQGPKFVNWAIEIMGFHLSNS